MKRTLHRKCKNCGNGLIDTDPHIICKTCRQPDPREFYCSIPCEGCDVIKKCKPLFFMLHKQELSKLEKKIDSKLQAPVKKKYDPNRPKITGGYISGSFKELEELQEISSNAKRMSGSESSGEQTFGTYSSPGADDMLSCFTQAVNNFFSSFRNSYPNESASDSSDNVNQSAGQSIRSFNDYSVVEALISFFSCNNPSSIIVLTEGSSGFKITSKTGDILNSTTILGSPLQADKLTKILKVSSNCVIWPPHISYADLMSIGKNLPYLRLHPKIRHLQNLLFGNMIPSLPKETISVNFALPKIPVEAENRFKFAKQQLKYLLLVHSIIGYCNDNMNSGKGEWSRILTILGYYIEECLKNQGNFVGVLVHEIRRDLLAYTESKDPQAIPKLIKGPIHQNQFFGPYVKDLQDVIKWKGSDYCLKIKCDILVNLMKLPQVFQQGGNFKEFVGKLNLFFHWNKTRNEDKLLLLLHLLPESLLISLRFYMQSLKAEEKTFDNSLFCLDRICCWKKDQINRRYEFSQTVQVKEEGVIDYAFKLAGLIISCNYGTVEREMLRDQFIFGLYNKEMQNTLMGKPEFGFEECFNYTLSASSETKLPASSKLLKGGKKRKFASDENQSEPGSSKRVLQIDPKRKMVEVEVTNFYSQYASTESGDVLRIKDSKKWYKIFRCEAKSNYGVYCPWTGKILRCS